MERAFPPPVRALEATQEQLTQGPEVPWTAFLALLAMEGEATALEPPEAAVLEPPM